MTALFDMGVEVEFPIVRMLKIYVRNNVINRDVKLPLVLMAIRFTPHNFTGVPLQAGTEITLSRHLLYHPEDVGVAAAHTAHKYMT